MVLSNDYVFVLESSKSQDKKNFDFRRKKWFVGKTTIFDLIPLVTVIYCLVPDLEK